MVRGGKRNGDPEMGTAAHTFQGCWGIYQVGVGRKGIQGKSDGSNIHIFIHTPFIPNCHSMGLMSSGLMMDLRCPHSDKESSYISHIYQGTTLMDGII